MRKKDPYVASMDRVRITREGDTAIIEYADPDVATIHMKYGPRLAGMSDQDVLDDFNEGLVAMEHYRAEHPYVAVEIPPGKPQIYYSRKCAQWVPRGNVLRCYIEDGGPDGELTFQIDDRELSLTEFERLLRVHAGWGMRVVFVPHDATHEEPEIEVREPEKQEEG